MDLSEQLKSARKEAGLTQEQAAEELGVTRQTISNWENGRTWPDIASVVRMSERYSVSLDRLLKGESGTVSRYVAYLEESTGVVKSRERLIRVVAWAATLLLWAAAHCIFILIRSRMSTFPSTRKIPHESSRALIFDIPFYISFAGQKSSRSG